MFVRIVDAKQRSCEGGDLTEADEERFVDLSFRVDERAAEEEDEPAQTEDGGCDELEFNFHIVKNYQYYHYFF